ncbi:unnamed protein product [Ambrosiozyma monospora]|uniref:Unnamed protein product n=1 Tax=Ambrosiozyma monospora TaxID=43982 RepID=A0A9W6YYW9_AMBMO|nr:unnamed protein product [Ambrosiozyma monospora]
MENGMFTPNGQPPTTTNPNPQPPSITNNMTNTIGQPLYQLPSINGMSNVSGYPRQVSTQQQMIQDQQQQQQQQQQAAAGVAGPYRPLNVRDALTYLDQVKLQFSNQTDVYTNFLDIMKDFKSQKLIDGFNTFLPQGFSIECSTTDPSTIIVTTPDGRTIRQDPGPIPYDAAHFQQQQQQQQQQAQHQQVQQPQPQQAQQPHPEQQQSQPPMEQHYGQQPLQYQMANVPSQQYYQATAQA